MAKNTRKDKSLDDDAKSVDCGDLLDISMVNEIYHKLKNSLDSDGEISVDVSNIQRIDAAGVQMLCAFYQDAKSKEFKCKWLSPSEVFLKSVRQLGLEDHLGLSIGG